jgi:cytochrome c-type biogenesis protein CcmH
VRQRGNTAPANIALSALLAVVLLLIAVPGVVAQDVYSEETLKISRQLQCPICHGETVADSGSQIARQMRDVIEQKVRAGESEQEILDFFVARYGESILSEPPKSGFTLGLWWMPVAVVVFGALIVALFVRERTRRGQVAGGTSAYANPADDEELEEIAREVLGTPGAERMSGA